MAADDAQGVEVFVDADDDDIDFGDVFADFGEHRALEAVVLFEKASGGQGFFNEGVCPGEMGVKLAEFAKTCPEFVHRNLDFGHEGV